MISGEKIRSLFRIIFMQELFYGAFLVVLGAIIGVQHGWESGLTTFMYSFVFFQVIIFWINRKVIKSAFSSKVGEKK